MWLKSEDTSPYEEGESYMGMCNVVEETVNSAKGHWPHFHINSVPLVIILTHDKSSSVCSTGIALELEVVIWASR